MIFLPHECMTHMSLRSTHRKLFISINPSLVHNYNTVHTDSHTEVEEHNTEYISKI